MNERLLARFDRAGILVWNQAPIWQRDHGAHLLWQPKERERALLTVRRTVTAGAQPSVGAHALRRERADLHARTRSRAPERFLLDRPGPGARPRSTLPISVDIKGRPGYAEQFTYHRST